VFLFVQQNVSFRLTVHKPNPTKPHRTQCCATDLNTTATEEERYYNQNKSQNLNGIQLVC
jgi:hypothetical protein